jgi:hypothetical protein
VLKVILRILDQRPQGAGRGDEMTTIPENNETPIAQNLVDEGVRLIRTQQSGYKRMRGRRALAEMVADGYVCITTIIASVPPEDQALILSQYQIKIDGRTQSMYSPWIAAMWGEEHIDTTKTADALDGKSYVVWQPNASMAVYAHTMHELLDNGVMTNHADWIMSKGGAQVVANERKARLAKSAAGPAKEKDEEQRKLYLSDGPRAPVDLNTSVIMLPEDAGRFVSIIVERLDDGTFAAIGVAEKDATAKLTKLAKDNYATLLSAREEKLRVEAIREEVRAEIQAASALASASTPVAPERQTLAVNKPMTPELMDKARAKQAELQAARKG